MIKLKKLTAEENERFRRWCEDGAKTQLEHFEGEEISHEVDISIDETKVFNNKLELGRYLYKRLKDIQPIDERTWNFLVTVYYKQLLKSGRVGSLQRFYLDASVPRYPFTHLLKPVFDIYNAHADDEEGEDLIRFLLLNSVNESGDIYLDTVQRQDTMKNRNFILVSKALFYDDKNNRIARNVKEPFRRLIDLFGQYARTYDLYSMPAEDILDRLISKHPEFDRFRQG